jgi:hypothetical protein
MFAEFSPATLRPSSSIFRKNHRATSRATAKNIPLHGYLVDSTQKNSLMHKTLHQKIVAHRRRGKNPSRFFFFRKRKIDQFSNFSLKKLSIHRTIASQNGCGGLCLHFIESLATLINAFSLIELSFFLGKLAKINLST